MAWNQFHIVTMDPQDQEQIRQALEAAGITVSQTIETTHEHEGVIMTRRMAGLTWDSQTGNNDCDGSCAQEPQDGRPPHRPLTELSPAQQTIFTDRVLAFMSLHRGDLDMDLGGMDRLGPPVATEPCT